MHHPLKCLHTLQRQGEKQKYKKITKSLFKAKYLVNKPLPAAGISADNVRG